MEKFDDETRLSDLGFFRSKQPLGLVDIAFMLSLMSIEMTKIFSRAENEPSLSRFRLSSKC